MSFLRAARVTGRIALTRALRRPSTLALCVLALVPPAVGALLAALDADAALAAPLAVRLVAPLFVAALVAGPVGEAYEQRTVLYYYLRPMPRSAVLWGEWLGYAALASLVLLLCGALTAAVLATTAPAAQHPAIGALLRLVLAVTAAGPALAGLCAGAATLAPRRPLVATVAVLTLTEGACGALPPPLRYLSLGEHLERLAGIVPSQSARDLATAAAALGGQAPSAGPSLAVSALVLALYGLVPLVVASLLVRERDVS